MCAIDTAQLERSDRPGMMNVLYGTDAYEGNCIAFCWHHHKWLTVTQMKKHKCLAKQCDRLEKKEGHPYWVERDRIKAIKKARKK